MQKNSYILITIQAIKSFAFVLMCFFATAISMAQTPASGESTLILDNKKDIYHQRNKHAREKLIEAAVLDAIEKTAPETISTSIDHTQLSSTNEQSFEEVFEEYVSKTLLEKHVEWQRTSSYQFARDENNKKKWICKVEGEIKNLKGQSTINGSSDDIKSTSNSLNNFITRKSYNIVHLNAGSQRGVLKGDKFVAYRDVRKKTSFGENWVPKKKGLIVITYVDEKYAVGRVIKGVFTSHESQQAAKTNFKTTRAGLEYRLSSTHEQINRAYNPFGLDDTTASINTYTHTLYIFQYGMVSRTGFKVGFEVYDSKFNLEEMDTAAFCFVPKIEFNVAIGLVPDFLYIKPTAAFGYLTTNIEDKGLFFGESENPWGADIVLEADISVHIRMWDIDMIAGVAYKYIHDLPDLSNFYPHIGISYNFVKYTDYNFDVVK